MLHYKWEILMIEHVVECTNSRRRKMDFKNCLVFH